MTNPGIRMEALTLMSDGRYWVCTDRQYAGEKLVVPEHGAGQAVELLHADLKDSSGRTLHRQIVSLASRPPVAPPSLSGTGHDELDLVVPMLADASLVSLTHRDGTVANIRLPLFRGARSHPTKIDRVANGVVLGESCIIEHGQSREKFSVALVGEGFTLDEQPVFDAACRQFSDYLRYQSWYPAVGRAINLHRISVASEQSGAGDPLRCGDNTTGSGSMPRTCFGATFCGDPDASSRLWLAGNNTLARRIARRYVPGVDAVAVLVNSRRRGGSSSNNVVCWTSLSPDWCDVLMHELGHLLFDLWDEYDYFVDDEHDDEHYYWFNGQIIDPDLNVTTATRLEDIPWKHHIDAGTVLPTLTNPDSHRSNVAPNPHDDNRIGLFEGAGRFRRGLYRPAFTCKMRQTSMPFCAVCSELIERKLSRYL